MSSFRDDGVDLDPPWLQKPNGAGFMRSFRTVLDALVARTVESVKLPMPGEGSPTALGYVGNDRNIERGPNQTDDGYVAQLRMAFDTWRNAGGARTLLTQLRAYFAPSNGPPMRLVSNRATWHEIDPVTGVVTKTIDGTNWDWDGLTDRWWRGWPIIDVTGLWELRLWGDGIWGDGVWGSTMTESEVISIRAIVAKWKPANVYVPNVILVFDPTLFEVADSAPPNPNGNGEDPAWRATLDANFLTAVGT